MEQTAQPAPSPTSSSFAVFLAALAEPAPKPANHWVDDGLADDIATLSYENALRVHARYRAAEPSDYSPAQTTGPAPAYESDLPHPAAEAAPAPVRSVAQERNLKRASITVRLSKAECAQLRQRADEAGLTVSAYLRSCTFEAESLRVLVKDTMAQLQSATAAQKREVPPRRSWLHWLTQLLTPWHGSQRVVRA
jgi:pyruvate/2-oxoglutarate dehydrogenase complex dihydrolipoamide acyltransferase (E2) component